MSPHSKQVYCYDSDNSHSTDDLLLSTLQSSVFYSSSQRVSSKDVDHHTRFFMTDKMTEAGTTTTAAAEDSKGLLQCWWLPKASKQPRHNAEHRSASARPQLVEDPYLTRTYHGPRSTCAPGVLDGRPPREDSTTRRVLPDSGGVPDSDSLLWRVQDSVSRPPLTFATAHTPTAKRPHKSSSSRVSTFAINPPSIHHKSSNVNSHNHTTTNNSYDTMTPETHQENGSWGERPRSRSIAIVKRHHHQRNANNKSENDFDASTATFDESPSDTSSTERMYDWATWCMYNRIIDHRRNSMNSSTRSSLSESSMPATSESFGDHATDLPESSSSSTRNASDAPWDYCHDGEVFELEI